MEVMKCPLFMYRYETRSGRQFIDAGVEEGATSNQAGYASAVASTQEEEPIHEYDDGESAFGSQGSGSGDESESLSDNDDDHGDLDEESNEDDENDESVKAEWETDDEWDEDDEDEGEWSDVDEDD
jgi:hypothetical protein